MEEVSLLRECSLYIAPNLLEVELKFFKALFKEIGGDVSLELPNGGVIFGKNGSFEFIVSPSGEAIFDNPVRFATNPTFIAFNCLSIDNIKAAYKAGIAAGGKDNGDISTKREVAPEQVRAYVISPVGHNIGLFLVSNK